MPEASLYAKSYIFPEKEPFATDYTNYTDKDNNLCNLCNLWLTLFLERRIVLRISGCFVLAFGYGASDADVIKA